MKTSRWWVVVLAVGLLVGSFVGNSIQTPAVIAQGDANPMNPGRFQISAWGAAYPGGYGTQKMDHGCYIVDTTTGALWHAASDGKTTKVSDKLP